MLQQAALLWSSLKTILTSNDFFSAGIGLLIFNYFASLLRNFLFFLWNTFTSKFFYTLYIDSSDEAYQWLIEWLAEQPYSKTARNLSLKTRWGGLNTVGGVNYYDPFGGRATAGGENRRPNVYYVPHIGTHMFFYKGHLMWFSRLRKELPAPRTLPGVMSGVQGSIMQMEPPEYIKLTMLGYKREFLQSIVQEAMELSYSKSEGKTWIYTSTVYRTNWTRTCSKTNRSFESVILKEGVKESILNDVEKFKQSADWYRQCGVPWRRGYLLYGPPGTGKTSFILALAGKLNMSVCIVNLAGNGMTDDRLADLLNHAPHNSLVLLEDVDAAFVKRVSQTTGRMSNTLTFSGLLNAIDGIATGEGRILFMTTNHIEKLAPALIRPGRIDMKIHFGLADKSQVKNMFLKFYPNEVETAEKLQELIPSGQVSPAELQGFYMLHRDNPKAIVGDVERWLKELEEERKRDEEYIKQRDGETERAENLQNAFSGMMMPLPKKEVKKEESKESIKPEIKEEEKQMEEKETILKEKKEIKDEFLRKRKKTPITE